MSVRGDRIYGNRGVWEIQGQNGKYGDKRGMGSKGLDLFTHANHNILPRKTTASTSTEHAALPTLPFSFP